MKGITNDIGLKVLFGGAILAVISLIWKFIVYINVTGIIVLGILFLLFLLCWIIGHFAGNLIDYIFKEK